jgi:hypothetical protein
MPFIVAVYIVMVPLRSVVKAWFGSHRIVTIATTATLNAAE